MPLAPQVSAYKTCNYISLTIDNASSANTYQWEILTLGYSGSPFNNGLGFNINIPYLTSPGYIAYRLKVTNVGGTTTVVYTVNTLPCNNWHLNVYPNPGNDYVNFELENFTEADFSQGLKLRLIDANFNFEKEMPISQSLETMDVSNVNPGYHYGYIMVNGENVISGKFLIEH